MASSNLSEPAASENPTAFPGLTKIPNRRYPVGAEILADGSAHFRVWAPSTSEVHLVLAESDEMWTMTPEENGYFSLQTDRATAGTRYRFQLNNASYPDPISRFQPEGPHGPSEVVNPANFPWTDAAWPGVPQEGQVVYELHIGTFTPEGNWAAAIEKLPYLAELGITIIEVMPLSDFPGSRGWGYDGVNLFAPTRLYGTPDEVRAFNNRAHELGLGVILDVVYNHFGPDGNYLVHFSRDYLHHDKKNEWGDGINFDGENCAAVREFFIMNAAYWIDEFHFDGLRLDATQQIHDASEVHLLTEIGRVCRAAGNGRDIYLVAENDQQSARIVRPEEKGGYNLTALWNDDFHHSATVVLTGRNEGYYSDYQGSPQEFVSLAKRGFLYQGQGYKMRNGPRGTSSLDLQPFNFVICLQNHDQIANSLWGQRAYQLGHRAAVRAMTTLLLLNPATPMLFQGQEFAASSPFLYFADHHPELARLVSAGRAGELEIFASIATEEAREHLPDPEDEETFLRCKLDFSELDANRKIFQLHRDLIHLRKSCPHFSQAHRSDFDGAVIGRRAFILRFFRERDDRILVVNLDSDLFLESAPEPLLAPLDGMDWGVIWSSENPNYGGGGTPRLRQDTGWAFPGFSAFLLGPITS